MASVSFRKGSRKAAHWTVGVLLIPVLWAGSCELIRMVPAVGAEGFKSWWLYAAGAGGYILFEHIFKKPMWFYVVAHELTHAFSGLLSGAKIHSIKASSKSGEVRLSKSNAFIALSPYVVPFYSALTIILYAALRHWWNPPHLLTVFKLALGASLMFHVSHTYSAFHGRQPDLKVLGFFLSGVLILLGNILILGVLGVSLFSKTPSLRRFGEDIARESFFAVKSSFKFSKVIGERIVQWIQ